MPRRSRPECRASMRSFTAATRRSAPTSSRGGRAAARPRSGLQFLLDGLKRGERGLYITLSESRRELLSVAERHGWSLDGDRDLRVGAARTQPGFRAAAEPHPLVRPRARRDGAHGARRDRARQSGAGGVRQPVGDPPAVAGLAALPPAGAGAEELLPAQRRHRADARRSQLRGRRPQPAFHQPRGAAAGTGDADLRRRTPSAARDQDARHALRERLPRLRAPTRRDPHLPAPRGGGPPCAPSSPRPSPAAFRNSTRSSAAASTGAPRTSSSAPRAPASRPSPSATSMAALDRGEHGLIISFDETVGILQRRAAGDRLRHRPPHRIRPPADRADGPGRRLGGRLRRAHPRRRRDRSRPASS